jgi:hypothetical protein
MSQGGAVDKGGPAISGAKAQKSVCELYAALKRRSSTAAPTPSIKAMSKAKSRIADRSVRSTWTNQILQQQRLIGAVSMVAVQFGFAVFCSCERETRWLPP